MTTATLTTYKTAASTELGAVSRIIKGMREAGWKAHAYNDGEDRIALSATAAPETIGKQLMATEEAWLYWVDASGACRGTMYFVFGNSPWEVMADCSMDDGVWDADLKAVEEAINLEGI